MPKVYSSAAQIFFGGSFLSGVGDMGGAKVLQLATYLLT